MMRHRIKDGAVLLRELEAGDVPLIHAWREDRLVTRTLTSATRFVNGAADEQWFARYMASRDHEVRLAVVLEETGELIGVAYLLLIDWLNRSAQYGLMVGAREQWGRGIGCAVTEMVLAHAFDDLNLHRVYLDVFDDHAPAINVYERCGFVREGVSRDAVFKDGRYRSLIRMARLSTDTEPAAPVAADRGATDTSGDASSRTGGDA